MGLLPPRSTELFLVHFFELVHAIITSLLMCKTFLKVSSNYPVWMCHLYLAETLTDTPVLPWVNLQYFQNLSPGPSASPYQ